MLLVGCLRVTPTAPAPVPPPLTIDLLYPDGATELEMGQDLRTIVQLRQDGRPVTDARLTAAVLDPSGELLTQIEAEGDDQGVYRTPPWTLPHRSREGVWRLALRAKTDEGQEVETASFFVRPSTSELLLERYGFWIDAPALGGVDPFLAGEFGDAQDGRILWGGVVPSVHILPAAWIEIQWRHGRRPLEDEQEVLRFFQEDLGRYGATKIRSLGPIVRTTFKHWPAWWVGARGEVGHDQVEWLVFNAPEVDRTFAVGTTVVLPPTGIDAPAALRDSFAVFPDIPAAGVAPAQLPRLLPAPELLSPPLGSEFTGEVPIVLSWDWIRPLEDDEAFLVRVDYNYGEANPQVTSKTRETHLTLPSSLYRSPNCRVFNWQVSVIQDEPSAPPGQVVSFDSLVAYLLWSYPAGEARPFPLSCPNEQY